MNKQPRSKGNLSLDKFVKGTKAAVGTTLVLFNVGLYAANPVYGSQPQESVKRFTKAEEQKRAEQEKKSKLHNLETAVEEEQGREYPYQPSQQLMKTYKNIADYFHITEDTLGTIYSKTDNFVEKLDSEGVNPELIDEYAHASQFLRLGEEAVRKIKTRVERERLTGSDWTGSKQLFDSLKGVYYSAREHLLGAIDTLPTNPDLKHALFIDYKHTHTKLGDLATDLYMMTGDEQFKRMGITHTQEAIEVFDRMMNTVRLDENQKLSNIYDMLHDLHVLGVNIKPYKKRGELYEHAVKEVFEHAKK